MADPIRWTAEFTVPPEVTDIGGGIKSEDGGQALICYMPWESEPVEEGGDGHLTVTLQSWDESGYVPLEDVLKKGKREPKPGSHPLMHKLMGRKVRITVETID